MDLSEAVLAAKEISPQRCPRRLTCEVSFNLQALEMGREGEGARPARGRQGSEDVGGREAGQDVQEAVAQESASMCFLLPIPSPPR